LLKKGADVNFKGYYNWSPLMYAIKEKTITDITYAKLLLKYGADVNAIKGDTTGIGGAHLEQPTPLILAVQKGNLELVKLLIRNGADINRKGFWGSILGQSETLPLIEALNPNIPNNLEILKLLIKSGADVNIKIHSIDNSVRQGVANNRSAINFARSDNNQAAVELLLQAGAQE